jgi:peptide deformylase
MAILKIAKMGHPVLLRRADEIVDPMAPAVQNLIEDMFETMVDADGLGLAAPQVHVPLRLVIFHAPNDDGDVEEPRVLINPEITPLSQDLVLGWEGCLSVPGLRGKVPRYHAIRYTGLDAAGNAVDVTAEGMHARVVQHECDHLDGRLYPTQMADLADLIFDSEWRHHLGATGADEGDDTPTDREGENDHG